MDERSIREIIREELKKLKGMTWGQRLGYIWDYYKPLMAAILAVILVISIGVSIYRNMQINHLLNVYFVNCNSTELDAQAITDDFAEYIGGIGAKDEILLDTSTILDAEDTSQYSMASQMKFTAVVAAGDVDVAMGLKISPRSYQRSSFPGGRMPLPMERMKRPARRFR